MWRGRGMRCTDCRPYLPLGPLLSRIAVLARCGLLLQMSWRSTALSVSAVYVCVCVCLGHDRSPTKTVEPIEVLVGVWTCEAGPDTARQVALWHCVA